MDESHNENEVAKFIREYLEKAGKDMTVEKQKVETSKGDRFNVVAKGRGDPKLLFCCHTDTVSLKQGWKHKWAGEIDCGRLYGLGSSVTP